MATIKERAQEYAEIAKIRGDMPLELAEDVYIEIATEQKTIDDEFHRSEVLRIDADHTDVMVALNNEWSERLVALRAMLIDKACKWLKEQTYQEYPGAPHERLFDDYDINEFRKEMEE